MNNIRLLTILILGLLLASRGYTGVEADLAINAERTHQSFDDGSSDIDSVTLLPSLTAGYWTLSATLEWQHIEGVYFVNQRYPSLANTCQRLTTLSSRTQDFLIRRGRLTQQQLDNCGLLNLNPDVAVENTADGMTDVELFANYYLPPLSDNFGGTLGVGYKHDNGDQDKGLGTGTREAFVETSWLLQLGSVGLLTTVGYQFITANNTDIDFEDYSYGSLDLNWQCLEAVSMGVTYLYYASNVELLGDLDYLEWYLEAGTRNGFSARLSYRDYRDEPGYPNEDISGSISYRF